MERGRVEAVCLPAQRSAGEVGCIARIARVEAGEFACVVSCDGPTGENADSPLGKALLLVRFFRSGSRLNTNFWRAGGEYC